MRPPPRAGSLRRMNSLDKHSTTGREAFELGMTEEHASYKENQ